MLFVKANLSKGGTVLGKYNAFLYDDIGNAYTRKNLYLHEIAQNQSALKSVTGSDREKAISALRNLIRNKRNHPYNVDFLAYKKQEKVFLKTLNDKVKQAFDASMDRKLRKLQRDLFMSKEKVLFYKPFVNLTYDAELEYEKNSIIAMQLPDIIEKYTQTKQELVEARIKLSGLNPDDERRFNQSLKKFKVAQRALYLKNKSKLKDKRNEKIISEKALRNGIVELKKKKKELINIKTYTSEKKSTRELINNKKYVLTKGISRELKVLKSNIADSRRKIPVEVTKTQPIFSRVTFALPGLGQLLNKQYLKAVLFGIGTLFVYLIAIPYALGYGNYQGDGILGLVTLAEFGLKIDKSLIYMIEGIVAIFLVVIAVVIFLFSYLDVRNVERDVIKGTRPRNAFETLLGFEQDGFPYLVSLPALLVTVFIVLVPITTAILLSFTGMDPKNQSKFGWVGLDNYKLIATGSGLAGSVFWSILWWTLIWTAVATTLAIAVGFILAILANNERIKGKTFFRVVYLLPWAVPAFITIMFFSIMFSPDGALTTLMTKLLGTRILIKNDAVLTRAVLIGLQTWLGSSYVFLLSTGVLQAIPGDLYEAAQIDGATEFQKLKRITIPMVLFQTAPLLVGQYTFNFNNFSIIYLFNGGGPFNPSKYGNLAGSSDLLISYIYKLTMENQYQAIGAAISIIISMGLMLFAFIGFKNSKAFKEERL